MDEYYAYKRKVYRIERLTMASFTVINTRGNKVILSNDKTLEEIEVSITTLDTFYSISRIEILMRLKIMLQDALEKVDNQYYDFMEEFTQIVHRKDKTEWHKKK